MTAIGLARRVSLGRRAAAAAAAASPDGGRVFFSTLRDTSNTDTLLFDVSSGYDKLPKDIEPLVVKFSRKDPTPASLQMLMQTGRGRGDFGGGGYTAISNQHNKKGGAVNWGRLGQRLAGERILLQMAGFLRHELPVRLAHRILDLDQVPLMRDMQAVQLVKGIYVNSFRELTSFTSHIQNMEDEAAFANLLTTLYQKHAGVLVQMAQGAYQLRENIRQQQKEQRRIAFMKKQGNPWKDGTVAGGTGFATGAGTDADADADELAFERMEGCHRFLDRFYMSRIGIRFLAGQYLSLRRENNTSSINDPQQLMSESERRHYIGMICQSTSAHQCVRQATTDASMMCRRTYGRCPVVQVSGRLDLTFPYIPAYLQYILLELLKNALRATMDRHMNSPDLPVVDVVIADGDDNEDVVIKIADEGGGIPRSQVDKIWSYLFTTADKKVQQSFIGGGSDNKDHSNESPLAGLGYGLPISRSYCRYFGGDLDLISMEGYGTDAFVHLKRLGDSKEPVPV